MKIRSPLRPSRARLEIIPLIDIMFFLLASFMMVSLQMQKVRTLRASLPTATRSSGAGLPEMVRLVVETSGQVSVEGRGAVGFEELGQELTERLAVNPDFPVYISGRPTASHGSMIYALDYVRRLGVTRVAFAVEPRP